MGSHAPKSNLLIVVLAALMSSIYPAVAQLDDTCTVSVNGQTVDVNPDGSFTISNVPAGTNLVRVTAICQRDGVTLYGVSEFFEVVDQQTFNIDNIPLLPFPPLTLESISASVLDKLLVGLDDTEQIQVDGTFSDGNTDSNLAPRMKGSTYQTSNPVKE